MNDYEGTLNTRYNTATTEQATAEFLARPSVMLKVYVLREGNMWSASLKHPKEVNMVEDVIAFGETPDKACLAFDKLWYEGDLKKEQAE